MGFIVITQGRLKEVLSYNLETGFFVWNISSGKAKKGNVAGTKNNVHGYLYIGVDGRSYRAHRLAWLYVNGKLPEKFIDHIDGNRENNRICNLRECNNYENQQNRVSCKNSTSKYIGVCWSKNAKKWLAQIRVNGIKKYIGYFDSEEDAYKAYCKAKTQSHQFQSVPR